MRTTYSLVQVVKAIVADLDGRHWGYDLRKAGGVRSGVMYPILTRLLEAGWLEDGWEENAEKLGRPPRRYYRVTERGQDAMLELLRDAQADPRFACLFKHGRGAD